MHWQVFRREMRDFCVNFLALWPCGRCGIKIPLQHFQHKPVCSNVSLFSIRPLKSLNSTDVWYLSTKSRTVQSWVQDEQWHFTSQIKGLELRWGFGLGVGSFLVSGCVMASLTTYLSGLWTLLVPRAENQKPVQQPPVDTTLQAVGMLLSWLIIPQT